MSSIHDDVQRIDVLGKIWKGIIATNAATLSDKVSVTIPDLDPSLRIEGARWQSRDAVSLPTRGDECLVIFDNDYEPWIPVWWPF